MVCLLIQLRVISGINLIFLIDLNCQFKQSQGI
jgi:hypothetical protein